MGIRENIIKLRKIWNVTQDELGEIAGVTRGAVSQWEGGFSEPRMGAIQRMADYFNIRKSNIIEEGGMDLIDPVTKKQRPTELDHVAYSVVGSVEVPVLGKVHAGELMEHDEVEDTTRIPEFVYAKDPDVFMIHSEGDCVNKLFGENDDFVVSPNTKPQNGSVVVAKLIREDEEEYIIRQYFRTAQTLILSPNSYNQEHKDIIITADSDMSAEISGVIIWNQARKLLD